MQRRQFINKLGAGLAAGLLIVALTSGIRTANAANASRPNVILIMADDLGYETLGCNGGTSYRTPNLDGLARTGVRFTNCFANPLCSPTRVTLMTGRYMHRNYTRFACLPPEEATFGHMMQDAGYATAVVGKWQLGAGRGQGGTHPDEAGFDEYLLKVESNRDGYADPIIYSSKQPQPRQMTGHYGPDVFSAYIDDYLERNRNRPFFLYYPMFLTHFYFSPTPESPEWKTGDRRLTATHHLRSDPLNTRFFTDMVAYMDKNIGRIVRKLDELGLRENTLIIFLGDNGTEVSIRSRMGDAEVKGDKGSLTDEGTHVPMIVNWPGQAEAGLVADDPVVPADFFATIAEATGAKPRHPPGDGKLDGVSFLPRVTGRPGKGREWALVEYVHENRGKMYLGHEGRYVRDRRWKLYGDGVSNRGERFFKAGQFYDMMQDPGERHPIEPVRDSKESAEARQRLQEVLARHPVPPRLLGPAASSGFIDLFNGKDLSGWTTETGDWRVEEGALVVKNKGDHVMRNSSYLWTQRTYGDFVLELDYKVSHGPLYGSLERLGGRGAGANSGVFIRVEDKAAPVQTGIEIQVANVEPNDQLGRGTVGGIYDLVPPKLNMHKLGEWNNYRITCKGSVITIELNGKKTASADLNEWTTVRQNLDGTRNKFQLRPLKDFARRGYIGLQDHGTPAAFRNIRIKELGL